MTGDDLILDIAGGRAAGLRTIWRQPQHHPASWSFTGPAPDFTVDSVAEAVEVLSQYFGVESWPAGVPVQVHYAAEDPWVEAEEEVAPLGDAVRGAGAEFEEYAYPGSGHLFADPDLPEYDRASSEEMWGRVLAFLDRIDAPGSGVAEVQ